MKRNIVSISILLILSFVVANGQGSESNFRFSVTADMRDNAGKDNDNMKNFAGVLIALKEIGAGEFMLSPGDIDPPSNIRWSIDKYLGENFIWYPVVGNHEMKEKYMNFLRKYNKNGNRLPFIVNKGPKGSEETTFSFDFKNSHFVIINEYYDGICDVCTDGDIKAPLYNWLKSDLSNTNKKNIFVIGHEPAFVQPDQYSGRVRHKGDSLDKYRKNRDMFWKLLEENKVRAYFCGHTHNYSAILINNVWQIDAGHARGDADLGSPSTFIVVDVSDDNILVTTYRDIHDGNYDYKDIVKTFNLIN